MKRVWKFELRPYIQTIGMPSGAQVLSAGAQGNQLFVWALCDPAASPETRSFVVAGTGESVPEHLGLGRFIGTVFMGPLVWHVWEAA